MAKKRFIANWLHYRWDCVRACAYELPIKSSRTLSGSLRNPPFPAVCQQLQTSNPRHTCLRVSPPPISHHVVTSFHPALISLPQILFSLKCIFQPLLPPSTLHLFPFLQPPFFLFISPDILLYPSMDTRQELHLLFTLFYFSHIFFIRPSIIYTFILLRVAKGAGFRQEARPGVHRRYGDIPVCMSLKAGEQCPENTHANMGRICMCTKKDPERTGIQTIALHCTPVFPPTSFNWEKEDALMIQSIKAQWRWYHVLDLHVCFWNRLSSIIYGWCN